jgi:iron complex transport system substrate-binding protein
MNNLKQYLRQCMFTWSLIIAALCALVLARPAACPAATFQDALGREVALAQPPARIVALAPSLTEIMFYLGLEDRVAGVANYSTYPPAARDKPRVGSYVNLSIETIISLAPDLAIGTKDGNSRQDIELLEQAGITVFIVNPRSVESTIESIELIGQVCGIPDTAALLAAGLKQRFDTVRALIQYQKKPLVFLQINTVPVMTVNKTTLHNDLINLAGGVNMSADNPVTYPRISIEEVIRREPEVIIISSMERGARFDEARQFWLRWTSIPAVKKNRVHVIDSDLIDRPSPRIIDGLETLVRIIHPDIAWDSIRAEQTQLN